MDLQLIENLMRMLEKSELSTLDITENGMRIRLGKAGAAVVDDTAAGDKATLSSPNAGHIIAAGLTGTFYRAPAPGAEPYVKVGDVVQEGQVLGLVEAMKMLNPVEADRAGVVEAILVEDAEPVLPGQPLIRFARVLADV